MGTGIFITTADMAKVLVERPRPEGCCSDDPATEGKFEWSLDQLKVKEAWALFGSDAPGEGIVIGHPDTGFTKHPEIVAETLPAYAPETNPDEGVWQQLKGVEGVVKMSSESQDSRGQITLEFVLGTDLDAAITTVSPSSASLASRRASSIIAIIWSWNTINFRAREYYIALLLLEKRPGHFAACIRISPEKPYIEENAKQRWWRARR